MMKPKIQKVKIVVPGTTMERELSIQHAERLLGIGSFLNGGWELAKDSKYIYDEEDGCIKPKSNKANSSETV